MSTWPLKGIRRDGYTPTACRNCGAEEAAHLDVDGEPARCLFAPTQKLEMAPSESWFHDAEDSKDYEW